MWSTIYKKLLHRFSCKKKDRGEWRPKNATGYSEGVSRFEINTSCLLFPANKKPHSELCAAFLALLCFAFLSLHLYWFWREIAIEGMQKIKMLLEQTVLPFLLMETR